MKDTALILTNGRLATADAKTAHGLIRGTERFNLVGVIDPISCGKDAGKSLTAVPGTYRFLNPLAHSWSITDKNQTTASSGWR